MTHSMTLPYAAHHAGDSEWNHKVAPSATRFLGVAALLTLGFSALELLGGIWANSLALIGDAGHMVTDSASLLFALIASRVATRGVDRDHSFGHGRIEVLAAFINGLIMLGVVAWLVYEAMGRFGNHVAVNGVAVMEIAAVGLLINMVVAYVLSRDKTSLNMRAALMHVLGDMAGSIAALIAGFVIYMGGPTWIDALLSLLVAALLLKASISILKEAIQVLLDAVPGDLSYVRVGKAISHTEGVKALHDLHIWTMAPGHVALQCHVEVAHPDLWPDTLDRVRAMLAINYGITHATVQPEWH